jgi:hypothetical protein
MLFVPEGQAAKRNYLLLPGLFRRAELFGPICRRLTVQFFCAVPTFGCQGEAAGFFSRDWKNKKSCNFSRAVALVLCC